MLEEQVNQLNLAYAPANFEFVLSGVSRHSNSSW